MRQAIIGLFGIFALVFFFGAADTRLHFLGPVLILGQDGFGSPTTLPVHLRSPNSHENYVVASDFVVTPFTNRVVTIIADDCLRRLTINGNMVNLKPYSEAQLCDVRKGIEVNLNSELHLGTNHVEAAIEDFGGWFGIALEARPSSGFRIIIAIMGLIFACIGILFLHRWIVALDSNRRHRMMAWTIISLSTVVAMLIGYVLHRPADFIYSDMAAFAASADHFVQGIADPYDLFKPIGFGLLLTMCESLGDRYLILTHIHILSFVTTLWCMWRATSALFNERIGLMTLAVAAIHLPFLNFIGFAIPEATFTAVAAMIYWLVSSPWFFQSRVRQGILGVAIVLGFLLKGNIALFPIVLSAWLFFWFKNSVLTTKSRFALLSTMVLCALVAIMPFSLFLKSRFDTYNVVPTSGGLNFVEGKCPFKRNFDSNGANWMSPLFVQLNERTEKHWDHPFTDSAFYWREGVKCVVDNPAVLFSSARYVYYLFFDNVLWPDGQAGKTSKFFHMLFNVIYFPGFLLGFLIVLRKPRTFNNAPFLLVVALFLCSYLIKSELRYRIPFDVVILPLVVLGWDRIMEMTQNLESRSTHNVTIQRIAKWSYFTLACVLVVGLLCEI